MGKIIRNGITYGGTSNSAGNISYNNTTSGLNSVTVQNAITELKSLFDNSEHVTMKIVQELPLVSEAEDNVIYLIDEDQNDIYEMYIIAEVEGVRQYINIGDTEVDLSDYLKQVIELPTAGASEVGNIYQYKGATTANYTHGYIYECVSDGGAFSWVICPTFEAIMGETVGRFERDATTQDILGEYFNLYEDIVDPTTQEVTTHRNAATGQYSTARGMGNTAASLASSVEGFNNTIGQSSNYAHVEGSGNSLLQGNANTHVEGSGNSLQQGNANTHVEGANHTIYSGVNGSHIEGYNNATGANASAGSGINYIHIEGQNNKGQAGSTASHIEGYGNTLKDNPSPYTHVEGYSNEVAHQNYGHIEGSNNLVTSTTAVFSNHVEGQGNTVVGVQSSHIEGNNTVYGYGSYQSHVEGQGNIIGTTSSPVNLSQTHIEGQGNAIQAGVASLQQFHIEGLGNEVENKGTGASTTLYGSHIEGQHNSMDASASHVEGSSNTVNHGVINSHVEGIQNEVSSHTSHTEGSENINEAPICHIEGSSNSSTSNASNSHLEGTDNLVNSSVSHIEGSDNEINAPYSHVEGRNNTVNVLSENSHIEGAYNVSNSENSHTAGYYNINDTDNSTVVGQYNLPDSDITFKNLFNGSFTLGTELTAITDKTSPSYDIVCVWRYPKPPTGNEINYNSTTARIKINPNVDLTIVAPCGINHADVYSGIGTTPVAIVAFSDDSSTVNKIVSTETSVGDTHTFTFPSATLKEIGAVYVEVCCHLQDGDENVLFISQRPENLFVIGNGTDNNHRSNIITASKEEVNINSNTIINGNLTVTGSMNTTSETITSSNNYYGGHIRQDGECPFRYRRMLYFGNYTGDENPRIINDGNEPNPQPLQPGYYSLELEGYAGLPKRIMKMIENSIYSSNGDFKANMRHIVSYYCALLQHDVKSRIEITSITASNTTFEDTDGEIFHKPLVNYVILPPYDGSSGTYIGAAILDIVFNNFQA